VTAQQLERSRTAAPRTQASRHRRYAGPTSTATLRWCGNSHLCGAIATGGTLAGLQPTHQGAAGVAASRAAPWVFGGLTIGNRTRAGEGGCHSVSSTAILGRWLQ
jgi:hypothetical protein